MKLLKSKMFLGLCLIFLTLPFLINFLSCFQAPFESWEQPSSWTVFWGQYLSGFAAFAMLYVAWRTLLTTKEVNRPFIVVDIVEREYSKVFIRCRNIGHTTATDIKISLDDSFIQSLKIEKVKESLTSINDSNPFVLEPNGEIVWEIFCIPGIQLDYLYKNQGKDIKYPFKGTHILKTDWEENENLFKSNILDGHVSYNEYSDTFKIDYNNILDGISTEKAISNNLFSISMCLKNIELKLNSIDHTIAINK